MVCGNNILIYNKIETMNRNSAIIIIEDDQDDQEILTEVFKNLKYTNELFFFTDGQKALDFLDSSDIIPIRL